MARQIDGWHFIAGSAAAHPVSVELRPFVTDDAAWLDGWLATAAAVAGHDLAATDEAGAYLASRLRRERALRARIFERDGESVGVVIYRQAFPRRGAALFELVAMPAALARRGAAMRAVALAEREIAAQGISSAYAPAPELHGIAMYFWIRLGYRPLLQAGWPCRREGVAWLMRAIS